MHVFLLILTIVLTDGSVRSQNIAAPDMAQCQAAAARLTPQLRGKDGVRGVDVRCVEVVVSDTV